MTGIVLTRLLEKRKGLIINLGSVVGRSTVPFYGVYPATKVCGLVIYGFYTMSYYLVPGCVYVFDEGVGESFSETDLKRATYPSKMYKLSKQKSMNCCITSVLCNLAR